MTALPFDVTRCRPQALSAQCENCKRWADHPEQVFGNVTPLVSTSGRRDPACVHVPISLLTEAA